MKVNCVQDKFIKNVFKTNLSKLCSRQIYQNFSEPKQLRDSIPLSIEVFQLPFYPKVWSSIPVVSSGLCCKISNFKTSLPNFIAQILKLHFSRQQFFDGHILAWASTHLSTQADATNFFLAEWLLGNR